MSAARLGRVHLLERNVTPDSLAVLMAVPEESSVADVAREVSTNELLSVVHSNAIPVTSSSKKIAGYNS
jgi:hypothetical protein